jgi:uncharacterized repeat protein (TIGR03803 family)
MRSTFRTSICFFAAALAISSALSGQTLNTIYNFEHGKTGYHPMAGVVADPSGNLYGTTESGGASGRGVAYELVPPASPTGTWAELVLHSFTGQKGDGDPSAGLLRGSTGRLYGVTGPNDTGGDGTVFELTPPAGTKTHWPEAVLHAFTDSNGDGEGPEVAPILGPRGVLYGTTSNGGAMTSGIVYAMAPPGMPGGTWTEHVLFSFSGLDGDGNAPGPLTLSPDGTIYGVTNYDGFIGSGLVFQLTPPAPTPGGSWTETTLYQFGSQSGDSGLPNGVVLGPNGVLYGTAFGGNGKGCDSGCGSVFQLTPPTEQGGAWTETILHSFTGVGTGDGNQPNSTPVIGPGGVLYGTTISGGTIGYGTVYKMSPPSSPGGTWTEVILHSFAGGADGTYPNAVTIGPDGNLYGTTQQGGAPKDGVHNQGTVFQLVLQ